MFNGSNVIFLFDGTFEGFLCCVFETFEQKLLPLDICSTEDLSVRIDCDYRNIFTDKSRAIRVWKGLKKRVSTDFPDLCLRVFKSREHDKYSLLLWFIVLAFDHGRKIEELLTDPTVHRIHGILRRYNLEARRFIQFVRFAVVGNILYAKIEPENDVLEDVAPHFIDRYSTEHFIIHDAVRAKAAVCRPGESRIVEGFDLVLAENTDEEERYQQLWKLFFNTIAIKERINPRCQMGMLPKKYRKNMTEFIP